MLLEMLLFYFLQETLRKELVANGSKFNYPATKDGYLKIGKLFIVTSKPEILFLHIKCFCS